MCVRRGSICGDRRQSKVQSLYLKSLFRYKVVAIYYVVLVDLNLAYIWRRMYICGHGTKARGRGRGIRLLILDVGQLHNINNPKVTLHYIGIAVLCTT